MCPLPVQPRSFRSCANWGMRFTPSTLQPDACRPPEEQKLLSASVAAEPPSSSDIATMRSRATTLSSEAFNIKDTDVVFLALHGGSGEDGRIQSMLELAGLSYTGSNHIASAVTMDKELSKRLFRSVGVPTANWLMAPAKADDVAHARPGP